MAFAAALWGRPPFVIGESQRHVDSGKQNGGQPDTQTIRKLASQIVGQVITPEATDYDTARSIFNGDPRRSCAALASRMSPARSILPKPSICRWQCVLEATAGSDSGCAMAASLSTSPR
jgi:hypothetical protein